MAPTDADRRDAVRGLLTNSIDECSDENIIDIEVTGDFRYTVYLAWPNVTDDTTVRGVYGWDLKDIEKDYRIVFVGACVRDTGTGAQPCLALTLDDYRTHARPR